MLIPTHAYRPRFPTLAQAIAPLTGAAMWSWSTCALLSGYSEINPIWAWLPLPWMPLAQALGIGALAALGYRLADDVPWVAAVFALPWIATLAHDIGVVVGF